MHATFPAKRIKHDMSGLRRSAAALGLALLLGLPGRSASVPGDFISAQPNTSTASDSVVTFNEIMYHPGGNIPDVEWVELFNAMSIDIDLSNWRIDGGIKFWFPTNTILPAREYILVASDPMALQGTTGATKVVGPFAGKLGNNGQTLRLRNRNDRIMDELTYGDEAPWPVAADGSGASLAKRNHYNASSPAANCDARRSHSA